VNFTFYQVMAGNTIYVECLIDVFINVPIIHTCFQFLVRQTLTVRNLLKQISAVNTFTFFDL
jgi:hypothetical protein